ncbi:monovalent cation/H(+) antiporter subunit G [Corynebacterium gallinarum]|uniref:Monovalent cation/H(+) antiporter subunit G n=1 Tax=Corynebacterium gallinarum TaxID=2762214 RepID=A0A8I0LH67_9CORY|nr:monovalent cation/H(+) antiporter subunit G [Corynebacterium gallinarum]MBD8030110.1 monovalent cation/H(+) antiporter subunit G [Corynebacterium gallinarum]NMB22941.1 cation:proton antiporter [Corynebacterium sp.]
MNIQLFTDIISLIFILTGAVLSFSAAVGLVRFRDSMSRVHAITKPQTTGLILTVVGALIRMLGHEDFDVSMRGDMGILFLLILFAMLTSPVTAQRVGRVSRREGLYGEKDTLSRNDAPADRGVKKSG